MFVTGNLFNTYEPTCFGLDFSKIRKFDFLFLQKLAREQLQAAQASALSPESHGLLNKIAQRSDVDYKQLVLNATETTILTNFLTESLNKCLYPFSYLNAANFALLQHCFDIGLCNEELGKCVGRLQALVKEICALNAEEYQNYQLPWEYIKGDLPDFLRRFIDKDQMAPARQESIDRLNASLPHNGLVIITQFKKHLEENSIEKIRSINGLMDQLFDCSTPKVLACTFNEKDDQCCVVLPADPQASCSIIQVLSKTHQERWERWEPRAYYLTPEKFLASAFLSEQKLLCIFQRQNMVLHITGRTLQPSTTLDCHQLLGLPVVRELDLTPRSRAETALEAARGTVRKLSAGSLLTKPRSSSVTTATIPPMTISRVVFDASGGYFFMESALVSDPSKKILSIFQVSDEDHGVKFTYVYKISGPYTQCRWLDHKKGPAGNSMLLIQNGKDCYQLNCLGSVERNFFAPNDASSAYVTISDQFIAVVPWIPRAIDDRENPMVAPFTGFTESELADFKQSLTLLKEKSKELKRSFQNIGKDFACAVSIAHKLLQWLESLDESNPARALAKKLRENITPCVNLFVSDGKVWSNCYPLFLSAGGLFIKEITHVQPDPSGSFLIVCYASAEVFTDRSFPCAGIAVFDVELKQQVGNITLQQDGVHDISYIPYAKSYRVLLKSGGTVLFNLTAYQINVQQVVSPRVKKVDFAPLLPPLPPPSPLLPPRWSFPSIRYDAVSVRDDLGIQPVGLFPPREQHRFGSIRPQKTFPISAMRAGQEPPRVGFPIVVTTFDSGKEFDKDEDHFGNK